VNVISAGPLAAGPAPQAASSIEAITSKLSIKGNLLFIFSLLLNLNERIENTEHDYQILQNSTGHLLIPAAPDR
jgi:hypothetical protein